MHVRRAVLASWLDKTRSRKSGRELEKRKGCESSPGIRALFPILRETPEFLSISPFQNVKL